MPAGHIGQSKNQKSFSGTGHSCFQAVEVRSDPLAGFQAAQESAVQAAGLLVVNIFHTGRQPELGMF